MKSLFCFVFSFITFISPAFAEDIATKTIDERVNDTIAPITNAVADFVFYSVTLFKDTANEVSFPLILCWLVIAAVFFSFYLGFINIRGLKHSIRVLKGEYDTNPNAKGSINRFEVLSTELSGTVGLGNIAGVAVAISVGGPGATLWMIITAFFGMSTKFVEAALGVKYRYERSDGHIMGGPMYYLSQGFSERGWPRLGAFLAMIFAVCCAFGAFGAGGMFQSNQAHSILVAVTGGEMSFFADKGWLFGLIIAGIVGFVIIGGINRIAHVAEAIVPLMGIIYLTAGFIVIGINFEHIPEAIQTIITGAFSIEAGFGGLLGAIIMGVQRAAFSNEAGIGSAAIAHAPTKTDQPISEGFIGMLGPLIDTIIVCTTTALVIVTSGVYKDGIGMEGVALTTRAFESAISWFPYALAFAVIMFAFSTMLAWSYYGAKCTSYIFGNKLSVEVTYKIVFCIFVIIGAMTDLAPVISFTDAMVFTMAVPNIIGLYILAPSLKRELKDYWTKVNA